MKTPRYFARTLGAGAWDTIAAPGQYLTIVAISASTFEIGLDGETPEQVRSGIQIEARRFFRLMRIRNAGLVAGTITFYVSDEPVGMVDSAIAASLAAIEAAAARLTPADALTIVNQTVVAQTGVGSTQILAANPLRKWCLVTMDLGNAGYVYLGKDNTVTAAANSFFDAMAGGSWREHYTGAVWACSQNGTESVRAYEST